MYSYIFVQLTEARERAEVGVQDWEIQNSHILTPCEVRPSFPRPELPKSAEHVPQLWGMLCGARASSLAHSSAPCMSAKQHDLYLLVLSAIAMCL